MTAPVPLPGALRVATAADGIDAERSLLAAARAGRHGGLVWSAERPGLVVPAALARHPGFGRAAAASAARGWPVHRRPTGGGLTPQGPGIVTLALAGPAGALTTESAYARLCAAVARALAGLGIATETGALPGSFCDGRWNLLCGGRKIAGTAQRWARRPGGGWAILAHALVLDDPPLGEALAALDALGADLGLPPTLGTAVHTTVAQERGRHGGGSPAARLAPRLAAEAPCGLRQPG